MNAGGVYDGSSYCESLYAVTRPEVPYTSQVAPDTVGTYSEQEFKEMRGALTEGRYIVFEFGGYALTNAGKPATDFTATKTTTSHSDVAQRWVVHALDVRGNGFLISSARDGRYIGAHTGPINDASGAETYTVQFVTAEGYALKKGNGKYVTVDGNGNVQIVGDASYFKAYSVTYSG
jgi:phospholipase C